MDIVTHALMGVVAASPFLESAPVVASCFIMGSTLPDLDVLSRIAGKKAFLKCHQTYTHSIPVIACISFIAWLFMREFAEKQAFVWVLSLGSGMVFHSLLDLTNTYGIAFFTPLSKKRYCMELLFFIDSVVLLLTAGALALIIWNVYHFGKTGWTVQILYISLLILYGMTKGVLWHKAWNKAPVNTQTLLPSAMFPWIFLGFQKENDEGVTFSLNAITGTINGRKNYHIYDSVYKERIAELPQYQIMNELSPCYHIIDAQTDEKATTLTCCDLRTRNFQTTFGNMEIIITKAKIKKVRLHV